MLETAETTRARAAGYADLPSPPESRPEPMIQISQGGVSVHRDAVRILGEEFHRTGLAVIRGFLSPPVLNALLKRVASGEFALKVEEKVKGSTLFMPQTDPAWVSLHFMVNRPELFEVVSQISGIQKPGNFASRLHRTIPAPGHELDWHDDSVEDRTLGMNINLSTQRYEGGLLQVRNPKRGVSGEIGQLPPGDAFLFRIGDGWQHRLTPVSYGERTVAVGWFRTCPDWGMVALAGFRSSMLLLKRGR